MYWHLFSLAPVHGIGITLIHELVKTETSVHQNACLRFKVIFIHLKGIYKYL